MMVDSIPPITAQMGHSIVERMYLEDSELGEVMPQLISAIPMHTKLRPIRTFNNATRFRINIL